MSEEKSTRGRKTKEAQPIEHAEVNEQQIGGAMVAMRESAQAAQDMAVQLGYDGAMTVGALEDGIRFYQRRTAEDLLEMGKRLLLLKGLTPHGEFIERIDILGIEKRAAQRIMSATIKFSKAATSPLLEAVGNSSKLLELAVLDDEEIDALNAGESVRGVDTDEISSMTVRELRAALRQAGIEKEELKAENAADKELLATRSKDIAKLRTSEKRIKPLEPDDVLAELRHEVTAFANDAEGAIDGKLRQGFIALEEHHQNNSGDSIAIMAGIVGQLMHKLTMLRDEFGLLEVDVDQAPEWVNAAAGN